MKKFFLATWVVAALLLIASCGTKSGKTGLLVPKDAAVVVHINNASLSSKLSWEEIKQSNWYRELTNEAKDDTMAQQLLGDPGMTGVDAKSDFVIFIKKQGKSAYVAVQGSIKDASKFENFVKKASEGKMVPVKKGDITTAKMGEDDGVLSWDKSHFVLIAEMDGLNNEGMRTYEEGSSKQKFSADSLAYFGKVILELDSDDRLDTDKRFASMVKDGSDFHLWMNSGEYYRNMMGPMISSMGNLASFMEGNISASSFNFDNGKITMDSKQYYGKKVSSIISKYPMKPVTEEMAARIPSENVIAAMAFNFPPEAIKEFLKAADLYGLANMSLAKMDYSVDELVKASNGEILLSVSDLAIKSKTDTMDLGNGQPYITNKTEPEVKVLFAASVADKGAFEKLLTIVQDLGKGPMGSPEITTRVENNWFAIGNSTEQVNQFLAGNVKNKAPFVDKISGHPMGLFVDIQKLLTAIKTDARDSIAAEGLGTSLKFWQDITAYGGEFKDNAYQFHAEINMVDKNTNSLKQLNTFADQMFTLLYNAQKKKVSVSELPTELDAPVTAPESN